MSCGTTSLPCVCVCVCVGVLLLQVMASSAGISSATIINQYWLDDLALFWFCLSDFQTILWVVFFYFSILILLFFRHHRHCRCPVERRERERERDRKKGVAVRGSSWDPMGGGASCAVQIKRDTTEISGSLSFFFLLSPSAPKNGIAHKTKMSDKMTQIEGNQRKIFFFFFWPTANTKMKLFTHTKDENRNFVNRRTSSPHHRRVCLF